MSQHEKKHIYVIGLDDLNLEEMKTVHNAGDYEFHGVIPYHDIVHPPEYRMKEMLDGARETLRNGPAPDAIIGHWDFPTTSFLPILRREFGLPTPTLESVLYTENKYWSRIAHEEAVPGVTPAFDHVDPFDDNAWDKLTLETPFWLKPNVAFSSFLGFRIDGPEQFADAIETIREHIHLFAKPFDFVVDLCENRSALPEIGSGGTCIAEQLIGGRLCTLEGYVYNGEVVTYAILDSLRGSNNVSFLSYQYPSQLPNGIQNRMKHYAEVILKHIGMDQTPFNMEFFWDPDIDQIWLLEINPRISKSHCPILQMATGASHHEVAIDIAMGQRPNYPRDEGRFPMAAKFMPRVYGDALVTRVPSVDEIAAIKRHYPELIISPYVEEGMHLSDLHAQDSYSYEIADLFIGGEDEEELHYKFRRIMADLDFRFSEVLPTNYG